MCGARNGEGVGVVAHMAGIGWGVRARVCAGLRFWEGGRLAESTKYRRTSRQEIEVVDRQWFF